MLALKIAAIAIGTVLFVALSIGVTVLGLLGSVIARENKEQQ